MIIQCGRTTRRVVDEARDWAEQAATLIATRTGCTRPEAMRSFSRESRVSPGTLENLSRERLKRLAVEDYVGIQQAFIAEINRAIGALEAELERARARGLCSGAFWAELSEAQAAITYAKGLIRASEESSKFSNPSS